MALTIKFPNTTIFIKEEGAAVHMLKWAAIASIILLLFIAGSSLAIDAKTVISAEDILRKIQMNEPVNYQGVIVEGNLDLSKLKMDVVGSPIKITDSQIKGAFLFNDISFHRSLDFKGTEFLGKVDFSNSIFSVDSDFQDTVFRDRANFANSKFDDDANFYEANFTNESYFYGSEIKGSAIFINSKAQSMNFEKARIDGQAYFMNSKPGDFNRKDAEIPNPKFDGSEDIGLISPLAPPSKAHSSNGFIEPAGEGSALESGPMESNISEIVGQKGSIVHLAEIDTSKKKMNQN